MERKRPREAPSSSTDTVQREDSPLDGSSVKHPKLVLKTPARFLSPKHRRHHECHSDVSALLEDMLELETAEEVVQRLLRLIDSCKMEGKTENERECSSEEVGKCLLPLGKLAKTHKEDLSVCCVLVHALQLLVTHWKERLGGALPRNVQVFVLSLLDHEHPDVKVATLKCLSDMVTPSHAQKGLTFEEQVVGVACKTVRNVHHNVRVECLKLIGQLSHVTDNCEVSLGLLEEYLEDPDPRVRTASFQALFDVHDQNPKALPLSVYHKASHALADESSGVRSKAVRLIWALGLQHPNDVIPLRPDSVVELSMLDDAFVKICDLVNDSSMSVRALASRLLGDFSQVSEKFLDQTLDKKLMSHLRVVKSDHQRQRELHQGGGASSVDWDTGRSWGAGGPKMDLDPGGISLMKAGACGAFVHGLEDEFKEVRSAAVHAMCRLGMNSKVFAAHSLDYLVDMFSDEIEDIRLQAINSLRKISSTLQLRDDQLETVLSILEESSSVIRDALRDLLSSCRLNTCGGMNTTVHALLDNLKKYPHDCSSIWKCLQQLGSNHGNLVSLLVPQLLSTHPFFMGKEPDEDDPAYICILILVFNAAAKCPVIPALFPSHVFRHYTYLRDTLPHLVPSIKMVPSSALKHSRSKNSQAQLGTQFLKQVLSRVQLSSRMTSSSVVASTLLTCIADLLSMAGLNTEMKATAKATAIFLQCQLLINKVHDLLSQDVLLTSDAGNHQSISTITSNINEILLLSYRLEHSFVGLSGGLLMQCQLVRMAAHSSSLLLASHLNFDMEHNAIFVKMKQSLQERLHHFNNFCTTQGISLPAMLHPLVEMNFSTVANEILNENLLPLLSGHLCTDLSPSDLSQVQECQAELLEPKNVSREDFTKFVSSLALSVHVEATLNHVIDPSSIAVQVRFPDGRQLVFPSNPAEVRTTGADESRLDTSIILSHGVWTDPGAVEFSVVRRFQTDVSEDVCLPFQTPPTSKPAKTGKVLASKDSTAPTTAAAALSLVSPSFPKVANPVHSEKGDGLKKTEGGVLVISQVVKLNIHPLKKLNNSFF